MNEDRRMKNLQKKQAKKKYKEYKKNKNGNKKKVFTIIFGIIFIVIAAFLVYTFTKEEVEEEVAVQEEGQLKIEKVGEVSTSEVVNEEVQEAVAMTDEEVAEKVDNYLSSMNTEARVAQLFIISPEELTGVSIVVQAGSTTQSKLKEYPVGGLIFTEQNVEVVDQVKLMLNSIETYMSTPIFLVMDAEGAVRITNTGNTLSDVGFDMLFEEELYLVQDEVQETVDGELDVVIVENTSESLVDIIKNGTEILIVTDDFSSLYTEVLDAARSGELDTEILEERVRAILTYKVANGL